MSFFFFTFVTEAMRQFLLVQSGANSSQHKLATEPESDTSTEMTKIKRTPEWSPEMAQWNLLQGFLK